MRHEDPQALLVDTGGTLVGEDAAADELLIRAMTKMGYAALNDGPGERIAGPRTQRLMEAAQAPALVASNVAAGSEAQSSPLARPYVVRDVSGVRVGLVGVTSAAPTGGGSTKASLRPPVDALHALLPEVRQRADVLVVLADLEPAEAQALASAGLGLQVILGGRDVEPREASRVGDTILAGAGNDGRYVGQLTLQIDGSGRILSYENAYTALDKGVREDPDLLALRSQFPITSPHQ